MNSLPNHHFQNKSFYQLSFDGDHLTQYGGLIFFQELFSQLKLKERISKYLVTNDQRRYCRYMDSGFATPKLCDLIEKIGQYYLIKLKRNTVLSRLGDLSLPYPTPPTQKLSIKQDLGRTSIVSASSLNEKKETCSTMLFLSLQI